MPFSPRLKKLAYLFDPECWISYSGKSVEEKRAIEARRNFALGWAKDNYHNLPRPGDPVTVTVFGRRWIEPKPKVPHMPPLKVAMLLHFYACCEPFSPEKTRTSMAYSMFVREMLNDGLIKRPSEEDRRKYPGWAYCTTRKGAVLVSAICDTPLPVPAEPTWVMPKR